MTGNTVLFQDMAGPWKLKGYVETYRLSLYFKSSNCLFNVSGFDNETEYGDVFFPASVHLYFNVLDTSRGGSMDPGDYVKSKCVASGSRTVRYDI
ncbi:hypothetical protein M8C21_009523 [Ambrosia artemisiifolia]|uniref:Uncharacterized protein n=1 Tax=Ambrosia artemisiifolia TaxID=4212 RepID=A0AAD5BYF7_AMBAR|nr:hypothetical protein M8C21_009523 [Ambrosia artemisiifolia]